MDEDTDELIVSGTTSKTHIDLGHDTLEHGKSMNLKFIHYMKIRNQAPIV